MSAIMTGKKLLDMEEPLRAVDGLLRGIIEILTGPEARPTPVIPDNSTG
jgi:hypothetical protein